MERLLALCAFSVASTLALNTTKAGHRTTAGVQQTEIESVGADVVQSAMDRAAMLPFDGVATAATAADLTLPAGFGGGALWGAVADLDDYDRKTTVVSVTGPSGALDFTLSARVEYVAKVGMQWQASAVRTTAKQLTLRMRGPRYRDDVVLSRVYTLADI